MPGSALKDDSAASHFTRRLVEMYGARQPVGGPAPPALVARLTDSYGDQATSSIYECGFYRRDVAPLPGAVDWLLRTLPEVVVRPRRTEEVAHVVRLAASHGAAITVRAGASSALGGSVPVRGGVVLDLSALSGVVAVDPSTMVVRIRAGTVWTELERALAKHDLAPKSVPSSAPASTVGGWFCTGGYGIGSLEHGSFEAQVRSIDVVLADGQVRRLTRNTHPPMQWLTGSEGTLGVVTELELTVRPLPPMRHALIGCADLDVVQQVLHRVLAGQKRPYSVHVDDREVLGALARLGFAPADWDGGELVRIDWESSDEEREATDSPVSEAIAATPGARLLPSEAALEEWRERFRVLRVKQGGPSVVGAETLLPLSELVGYLRDIQSLGRRQHTRLMSYGHLASADTSVVMTMSYTDESAAIGYALDLGLVKLVHDLGAAHGGVPYGLGLWNMPHLRPSRLPVPLDELRRRKHQLDPRGIMNPGKGVVPLALMHPLVLRTGMGAAAAARRVMRGALQ